MWALKKGICEDKIEKQAFSEFKCIKNQPYGYYQFDGYNVAKTKY